LITLLLNGCCVFGSRTVEEPEWVSSATGKPGPASLVSDCRTSATQVYEQQYKSGVIAGCMKQAKARWKTEASALQSCTQDDPGYGEYRQLYIGRLASQCMADQGYELRMVPSTVCGGVL
jgi:hypothetical protein